ncbi:TrmH family RNA methyltransferase [Vallitalea okinawensis]|uniref:TrmH family RNA methyltransferase n=1 Tax=Vallitalea okinawensis TaxID=2078660 RepID=UPI000CFD43FC|nr:TrmH family RNA methyltransferase [Vallitalea okinawensis]
MQRKYIGMQHDIIKSIKKLKKGDKCHPYRFIIEGHWDHEKVMDSRVNIESLIVCIDLIKTPFEDSIYRKCLAQANDIYYVSEKVIRKLCDKDKASGLISICTLPHFKIDTEMSNITKLIVLDGLETPGNIGTIFRSCDGSGIDAVIIVNERAKINSYKTIKASMGGSFTIPWYFFDSAIACQEWLVSNGYTLVLADPHSQHSFKRVNYGNKSALVVGNERYGLSKDWNLENSLKVSIPMLGKCDSLNVGVAASIILYEMCIKET